MARYWVIAPFQSADAQTYEKVWQFDIANNVISIGWNQIGNPSEMSHETLYEAVASAYPDRPNTTKSLFANMLWSFYHDITPGDVVLARKGRKILAAIGTVAQKGYYAPGKNPFLASTENDHPNFIGVEWQKPTQAKVYNDIVFPMHTVCEISESQYRSLVEEKVPSTSDGTVENPNEIVLEKYLEEFIVSNFNAIFRGKLKIYEDAEGNNGQQYTTGVGPIDILAVEPSSSSFVVVELKKGRSSDRVVGQILRYMGWVKENLCVGGQSVKGLIICREPDPKLAYALSMVDKVDVRYYSVSFALKNEP